MTAQRDAAGARRPGAGGRGAPAADLPAEAGSALVIALVMIAVVAVVLVALLSYTGSSLRATGAVRSDRRTMFAADGAVEAAIQNVRNKPTLGYNDSATPCTFYLPARSGQPGVLVNCLTHGPSWRPGSGGIGDTNPGDAILTLGRRAWMPGRAGSDNQIWGALMPWWFKGPTYPYNWNTNPPTVWNPSSPPPWGNIIEPGMMLQATNEKQGSTTGPVIIRGPAHLNSTVASYGLDIIDQPDVLGQVGFNVRQPCKPSGGATITGGCTVVPGGYAGNDARFNDPLFLHRGQRAGQAFPTLISPGGPDWPVCAASSLVKFKPGFYNDAVALNDLFASAACNGKDFWFQPGFYYFDFRNNTPLSRVCDQSGGRTALNKPFSGDPADWTSDPNNVTNRGSMHEWCIRGNGKGGANRPHIIGGTPMNWNPAPTSGSGPMVPASAVTTTISGGDDFPSVANGKVMDATDTTTDFTSATADRTIQFDGATSSKNAYPPSDDFASPGNGRYIDGSTSASTMGGGSKTLKPAGSYDFPYLNEIGWGTWRWDGSPGNAQLIDGSSAHVSLSCGFGVCSSGSIRLNNYPKIPATATPTGATLRIRHRESLPNGRRTQRVTVQDAAGNGLCDWTPPQRGSDTTDSWTLPAGCLNTAARVNGVRVHYMVQPDDSWWGTGGSDWYLDGIELDVSWTDTGTRSLTLSAPSPTYPRPANTVVNSASLAVKHSESVGGTNPRLVVSAPGGGCTIGLATRTSLTEDSFDLLTVAGGACLGPAANRATALNGLSAAYTVDGPGSTAATVTLDGVRVAANATDITARTATVFSLDPAIPNGGGANLSSAVLTLRHHEDAGTNPRLVLTTPANTACGNGCMVPLTQSSTPTDFTLNLLGPPNYLDVGSNPASSWASNLNALKIGYVVNVTGVSSATASLDGARVDAAFTPGSERVPDLPTPACDPEQPGVQWLFGGDSRVYIPDAQVQLCAGPAPGSPTDVGYTKQQIAVFDTKPLPPMRATSVSLNQGYSNPERAILVGDQVQNPDGTIVGPAFARQYITGIAFANNEKRLRLAGYKFLDDNGNEYTGTKVPAGMHVGKVYARTAYWQDAWTWANPKFQAWNGLGQACFSGDADGIELDLNGVFNPSTWYSESPYQTVDVTSCFNTAAKLAGASAQMTFRTNWWFFGMTDRDTHFDGIDFWVELVPDSATAQVYAPANGCVAGFVGLPNYWDGYAQPDCALMKWDSLGPAVTDQKAQVSIRGTVYAPGGTIDIDDQGARCSSGNYCYEGVNYPILNRGVIARHLRFKAFKKHPSYDEPVIGCGGDVCGGKVSNPKLVTFEGRVGSRTVVTALVCYGPVLDAQSESHDVEIPDTGKWCSGEGNGVPRIVRWTVS